MLYAIVATPAEASQIVEIVNNATYSKCYFRPPNMPRTTEQEVLADMRLENAKWLVLKESENESADKTDRVVATIFYKSESNTEASLHMLSACKLSKGYGKILLEQVEGFAKKDLKSVLMFECVEDEKLVAYYCSLGYRHSPKITTDYDPNFLTEEWRGKIRVVSMEKTDF